MYTDPNYFSTRLHQSSVQKKSIIKGVIIAISQWSKLRSVIGHDQPDFQFDQTIFSWNLQKWPITEWDYLDSEVWQTACIWHDGRN